MEIRQNRSQSWFSREGSILQSMKLAQRLKARCSGEEGVFITLTYRRDEWESPRDLYHATGEDRHVRRFMATLAEYLGESLNGRWLCKLEFQRGGWVHWHILLLGVRRIDHADLTEMWGHGFTYVQRMTRTRIGYFAKYITKADASVPEWIYAMRAGSVKVIRSSPGFWGGGEVRDDSPPPTFRIAGVYRTIGDCVDQAKTTCTTVDEAGRYSRLSLPFDAAVQAVALAGGSFGAGSRPGWLRCTGLERGLRKGRGAAIAAPRLYLTDEVNPPNPLAGWRGSFLRWATDPRLQAA